MCGNTFPQGGVQEARPDADGGGSSGRVAQGEAELGQRCGARWRGGDIRLNADVAVCTEPIKLTSDEPLCIVGECSGERVVGPDLPSRKIL